MKLENVMGILWWSMKEVSSFTISFIGWCLSSLSCICLFSCFRFQWQKQHKLYFLAFSAALWLPWDTMLLLRGWWCWSVDFSWGRWAFFGFFLAYFVEEFGWILMRWWCNIKMSSFFWGVWVIFESFVSCVLATIWRILSNNF